ncbi:MAG: ABC transporter ATP-binding protein [Anaerolineae bacterium]|nr:ABC transporter ATP-binding protein [Anaerolineae bacterium]
MTDIAIDVQDVQRVYHTPFASVHALRHVSLRIMTGQFVVLKGRSGSGKTTLLNCIAGLDTPTGGLIRVYGHDLTALSDAQRTAWRRREVGFVFQSTGLLPNFSAYENLELMLRLVRMPRSERRKRILNQLDRVGLLQWADHRPSEMSGGQQQRVAIARALVTAPRLILADEPTSDMDSETTHDIMALFQQIVDENETTLLLSSHDPLVDEYVDTILYLSDGQIQES